MVEGSCVCVCVCVRGFLTLNSCRTLVYGRRLLCRTSLCGL